MKKLLTILVLIALIISFFQITSMYALYKEQLQGEYNTLLGAWEIKINEKDVTTSGQIETFTITDDQLGYVASQAIQAGKIAPGGKAYFDIIIDPTNTDVSIKYQINMESIDIPNVQIKLSEIENYFNKDGETDTINENVNLTENLYTGIIPIEKINQGYKNYLRLNFEWINEEDNNIADSILADATNATNKNITWTSNNESVATVSNGVITGIAEGTATITVKSVDGNYTDTCTVTVTDETISENISTTTTEIDKTQVTLKTGETESLVTTVFPENATNKNIEWTSDNEEVATVSNGVITGIAEGTAIITVKTVDGDYTKTCTVTVTEDEVENVIQVTGIELDKTNITLKKGETETLKQTIWAENSRITIPLEINLKQYTGEVISNGS